MKSIEELKEEQYDLKAKLHEIIELINSEQYYEFSDGEKGLINQQRVSMELYLSCLTLLHLQLAITPFALFHKT